MRQENAGYLRIEYFTYIFLKTKHNLFTELFVFKKCEVIVDFRI